MIFLARANIVKGWRVKLSAEGPLKISLGDLRHRRKVERGAILLLLDG